MSDESPRLLELARSISDGSAVDWKRFEDGASSGEDVVALRGMRLVAAIVEAHRSQQVVVAAPSPTDDVTCTLVEGRNTERRPAPALEAAPGSEDPIRGMEPPNTWGPLEILEKIGEGAFGGVYRARDPRLDREVALKLLRAGTPEGNKLADTVIEEGRLLARVRHPNVAAVFGAERHRGQVGLWMELIRGRTLADLLRDQGTFGAQEAGLIGLDLCRALAAVHRSDLIHLDVKAQNVMREEGGRIVLMDFSAGRDLARTGGEEDRRISGTPLYIAPEILRGEAATPRADLYSLGVLLYHLVTGSYPVEAPTLREIRDAHDKRECRLLGERRTDLSAGFVRVVERALAHGPRDRFPSAASMEQALATALGLEGREEGQTPSEVTATEAPQRRTRWATIALAAGLVTVALGIGTLIFKSGLPPARLSPGHELTTSGASLGSRDLGAGTHPSNPRTKTSFPEAGSHVDQVTGLLPEVPRAGASGESHLAPPSAGVQKSYSVEASFYRGTGARERLAPGDRVRVGDALSLEFTGSLDLYLYVVNEDDNGEAVLLFPLEGGSETNPLPAGQTHRIPGVRYGEQQYWQVTSPGGREHFLVVASPQRIVEIEEAAAGLNRPEPDHPLQYARLSENAKSRLRGVAGLVSGAPAAEGAASNHLFDLAERLASRAEVLQGTYVRKLDLVNPSR